MRYRMWGTFAATAGLAGLLAACSGSGTAPKTVAGQRVRAAGKAPQATLVQSATVAGRHVLTDQKGKTLYWLAATGKEQPRCNAACSGHWPAAKAPAIAGPGVNFQQLSDIQRPGGMKQITYAGHPLYTFRGDTRPGVAKGNGLTVPHGIWRVATPGMKAAKAHRHHAHSRSMRSAGLDRRFTA